MPEYATLAGKMIRVISLTMALATPGLGCSLWLLTKAMIVASALGR
jgi:hypothetical protein